MRAVEIICGAILIGLGLFIQYSSFRSRNRKAKRNDLTLIQEGTSERNFIKGVYVSILLSLIGALLIAGDFEW